MTHLDILPFFLLLALASGAFGYGIGYWLGRSHGIEAGELKGAAEERKNSLCRCIQYKRISFKMGCDHSRLTNGEPNLRGQSGQSPFPVLRSNGGRQDQSSNEDAARNTFPTNGTQTATYEGRNHDAKQYPKGEGEVPTIAPASTTPLGSNTAPEGGEQMPVSARNS